MNYINITVRGKIARAEGRARVVCGNSDYAVRFDFDAEWSEYAVKTARFVTEDGSYTDVQFEGSDCTIPILRNTRTLLVGVFAGNLRTTTAALIHAVPCITDPDGTPADPTPDVYAQLMERFNAMEAPAAVLYTPQELTDAQKATARENIGVATPDWEQSDEDQPDYIKNRPFYEVTTDTLLDLTIENWRSLVIGLDAPVCSWRVAGVDYIDVMPTSQENGAVQLYELGNVTVVVLNGQSRIYSIPSDADVHLLMRKSVVKQIDPKYVPNNRFTVTVTEDGNGGFTADKTIAEIVEAYEAEKDVVASFAGQELPLHMISNGNTAVFDLSTLGETSKGLIIGRAGVILTNELIIPRIYPVEKTSAMTDPVGVDSYGKLWSKADTSLNMTGATVGQIAKITAVDDSGKPTAWAAVDMPTSGGGKMRWQKINSLTLAEQTNEIIINKDTNGTPVADYNAVAMKVEYDVPADSTQESNNGSPWIYPGAQLSGTGFRVIASVAAWKTVQRHNIILFFGDIDGLVAVGNVNVQLVADPKYKPFLTVMDGVRLFIKGSADHWPVGTIVSLEVLSERA